MGSINSIKLSAVHFSKQQRRQLIKETLTIFSYLSEIISGTPGFEPGTAGYEAQMLPLCYAVPPKHPC